MKMIDNIDFTADLKNYAERAVLWLAYIVCAVSLVVFYHALTTAEGLL